MRKKGYKWLENIAMFLAGVGALNWGLIGLFKWNLVQALTGSYTMIATVLYVLIGVSGLWGLIYLIKRLFK